MATPTFTLPTSGSDPKRATKEGLENNINSIIQYLDNARIVGDDKGTEGFYNAGPWDASTGSFPTVRGQGGLVQNGDTFRVSVAGTVDGVTFAVDQRIIAQVDTPASTTYDDNWDRANTVAILAPVYEVFGRQPLAVVSNDDVADLTTSDVEVGRLVRVTETGALLVRVASGGDTAGDGITFANLNNRTVKTFEYYLSVLSDGDLFTIDRSQYSVDLSLFGSDSDANDLGIDGIRASSDYARNGKNYRFVAGTVRQTAPDAGWEFINDVGHDPLSVLSVDVNALGELVITFDFTADRVVSFVCGPDDFYAKQGMVIGSSVGFSTATIKGAAPMSGVITSSGVSFVGSLGWSDTSTVTHSAANGTCRIQHNDTYALGASTGQGVSLTAVMDGTDKIAGGGYAMSDVLSDEFTFNRMTPLSGLVFVSGGVVGIDTLCDGVSAVWNGTDNCFDVTVPEGVGGDNYPIIGMTTRDETSAMPYHYAADFISDADLIKVYVYSASTQSHVTTLANDMRFFFMKPSSDAPRPMSNADGMSWQFLRENVTLDFSKVFASSGNIWFSGIFEV